MKLVSAIINILLKVGVDTIDGANSSSRCNIFEKKSGLYATEVVLGNSEKYRKSAQERRPKSKKNNQVCMVIISHD